MRNIFKVLIALLLATPAMGNICNFCPIGGGSSSGGGVSSLNSLTGALSLVAGSGISITPSGTTITVSSLNSGTVTNVSVVSANGLNGTVSNPTTTPAITLNPTITGIMYSNGSTFSAAVASNFPTLNQNTTGTASNITGIVGPANGGSGSSLTPTNGQVPIGNGSTYTPANISVGTGLSIVNGAGSITINQSPPAPVVASSNTTVDATFYNKIVALNSAGGAFNLTLPAANTMANGFRFWIADYAGYVETNNVTVVRNGSDFIGGINNNYIFQTNYGYVGLWTDSSGWYFF